MTYTGGSHQGTIKTLWFHFWGAIMSFININSLWSEPLNILKSLSWEKNNKVQHLTTCDQIKKGGCKAKTNTKDTVYTDL